MMGVADPQDDNRWSDGPLLPRWALWLMLPGIITPMLIFGFILFSESAHDDANCPYTEVTRSALSAEAEVIEERRSCVGDVEERRYTLMRGGDLRVLGRRRFAVDDFADARYGWSAEISDQGEVVVTVKNQGHDDLLLREGTSEERAKGISY